MKDLIIGLVQMRCEKGAIEENLKLMRDYLNVGKLQSADIICFPEMNITGYIDPNSFKGAVISRSHYAIREVAKLCKEFEIAIIAGFVEENQEGMPFITQFAAKDGEILGFYRKKTVKDGEALWFSPGEKVFTFECSGVRCGISVCADIDDENIFKELAEKGSKLIFECAAPGLYGDQKTRNWQSGYEWWKGNCVEKLGKYARENNVYIAVSTQAGRTIDEDFPGGGYLFSPEGICLAESEDWNEGIQFVKVNIE